MGTGCRAAKVTAAWGQPLPAVTPSAALTASPRCCPPDGSSACACGTAWPQAPAQHLLGSPHGEQCLSKSLAVKPCSASTCLIRLCCQLSSGHLLTISLWLSLLSATIYSSTKEQHIPWSRLWAASSHAKELQRCLQPAAAPQQQLSPPGVLLGTNTLLSFYVNALQ